MTPMFTGLIPLGVAVLGTAAHVWRFIVTRTIPLAVLWLIVPFLAAGVAFLLAPPSLMVTGLAGAAVLFALLTVAAPVAVPALTERSRTSSRSGQDRTR